MKAVPGYSLRAATGDDTVWLPAVELAAATLFPPGLLPGEMAATPLPLATYDDACSAGWLWVAVPDESPSTPVGFALAGTLIDGTVMLYELDVHPAHGRRGLGSALVQLVAMAALARGRERMALVTFEHLPFNAPMYEKLGFVRCPPAPLPPLLAAELEADRERGLEWRVAMVRELRGDQ